MLSQGLMTTASYWTMEGRVLGQRWYTSGDALFTEAVFNHMGVLPTDPGAAYAAAGPWVVKCLASIVSSGAKAC